MIYDAIVIGAGAAGLTCAQKLLQRNKSVIVLEGRNRIGGRAFTKNNSEVIEYGAEFIHGNQKIIIEQLGRLSQTFYDVTDRHYFLKNGKLAEQPDFWGNISDIIEKISKQSKDHRVSDFLARVKVSSRKKSIFRGYVEGFHSADMNLMGTKGLSEAEETEDPDLNSAELFRPTEGYSKFFNGMLKADSRLKKSVHLASRVESIEWSGGVVSVTAVRGKSKKVYKCRKVVVTAPIGVLKNRASKAFIKWIPEVPDLNQVLQSVEAGHIQKITISFRSRFWESLTDKVPSFIHTDADCFFPTWWTKAPMRVPQLIAWQGGPKALLLSTLEKDQVIEMALQTLVQLTGKPYGFLKDQLLAYDSHDWTTDPYSRGAYSYITYEGAKVSRQLQKVFCGKIIFAGEGTASGSARGTVHGAMLSGERAANQV